MIKGRAGPAFGPASLTSRGIEPIRHHRHDLARAATRRETNPIGGAPARNELRPSPQVVGESGVARRNPGAPEAHPRAHRRRTGPGPSPRGTGPVRPRPTAARTDVAFPKRIRVGRHNPLTTRRHRRGERTHRKRTGSAPGARPRAGPVRVSRVRNRGRVPRPRGAGPRSRRGRSESHAPERRSAQAKTDRGGARQADQGRAAAPRAGTGGGAGR
jgi:hypothetical protein